MNPGEISFKRIRPVCRLAAWAILCLAASFSLQAAQDETPNVPPTATPQISQIIPNQAAPGTM